MEKPSPLLLPFFSETLSMNPSPREWGKKEKSDVCPPHTPPIRSIKLSPHPLRPIITFSWSGARVQWRATYHMSKYITGTSKHNKLLKKICSNPLPQQIDLHNDLEGQVQISSPSEFLSEHEEKEAPSPRPYSIFSNPQLCPTLGGALFTCIQTPRTICPSFTQSPLP